VAEKKDSTLLRPRKGLGFPDRRWEVVMNAVR
jgi:hypothetical protein